MSDNKPQTPARESKTLTTSHGHIVILKTYLTGRETNEFKRVIFEKTKFKSVPDPNTDPAEGKMIMQPVTEIDGTILIEQQLAGMGICVISIDAQTKNIIDILQDLPHEDFGEVDRACAELTKSIFQVPNAK